MFVRALAVVALSTLTLFPLAPARAQYVFTVTSTTAVQGDTATVQVLLDNTSGSIDAWSFGVCHEASQLQVQSVANGAAMPPSVSFVGLNLDPGIGTGWTVGVVLDFFGVAQLAPAPALELHTASYQLVGGAPSTAHLTICETLGDPTVELTLISAGNQVGPVSTLPGSIEILCPAAQASQPLPADSGSTFDTTVSLSWLSPCAGLTHDVYLGTAPGQLLPQVMGLTGSSFLVGPLSVGATYFWRVDSHNGIELTVGVIWSFTVSAPGVFDVDLGQLIYDLSGSHQWDLGILDDDAPCDLTLVQDGKGRVSGNGTCLGFFMGYGLDATVSVRGKLTTKNGLTVLALKVAVSGQVLMSGVPATFAYKGKTTLELDGNAIGSAKGKAAIEGMGKMAIVEPLANALTANSATPLVCTLEVATDSKGRVTGTARVPLVTGPIVLFDAKGKINTKKDEAKLRLKASDPAFRGAKLQLIFDSNLSTLLARKGKLLGQGF